MIRFLCGRQLDPRWSFALADGGAPDHPLVFFFFLLELRMSGAGKSCPTEEVWDTFLGGAGAGASGIFTIICSHQEAVWIFLLLPWCGGYYLVHVLWVVLGGHRGWKHPQNPGKAKAGKLTDKKFPLWPHCHHVVVGWGKGESVEHRWWTVTEHTPNPAFILVTVVCWTLFCASLAVFFLYL